LVTDNRALSPVQPVSGFSVQANTFEDAEVFVGTIMADGDGAATDIVGEPPSVDWVGTRVIVAVAIGKGVFVGGESVLVGIAACVWVSIP